MYGNKYLTVHIQILVPLVQGAKAKSGFVNELSSIYDTP